jgi:ParB family chromosome partitioning protein
MNVRRGGLGRGLGALIPAGPVVDEVSGARFDDLPIDSIEPNPKQPREAFDDDALAELVASVREVGVLQPVVVRELAPGRFQLVMGERRLRACRQAGLATVPAIIRDTPDDALLRDALLENLHRQQLNPLEEAAAYQQLLEEFGATHDQLADRIGRSRSQVTNTIRLLALPPTVQRRVAAGVLSAGHARALLGLPDAAAQERVATRIVAEGLSVRSTEEIVAAGEDQERARARTKRGPKAPALARLEESLSDLLETKVTVELGRRHGKLTVSFASLDDLYRVLGVMAPEVLAQHSISVPDLAGSDTVAG